MGREEEYVDDDKLTTVTVEAVDVSRDGLKKVAEDEDEEDDNAVMKEPAEGALKADVPTRDANGKRIWTIEKPERSKGRGRRKRRSSTRVKLSGSRRGSKRILRAKSKPKKERVNSRSVDLYEKR